MHGTCVKMPHGNGAVLLLGPSGAGKSDLALRLISRGCKLVSDDQVMLRQYKNKVVASAPPSIKALLEVRGVGIAKMPHVKSASIALVVKLVARGKAPRLPEPVRITLLDASYPQLQLDPFEVSATDKVLLAYNVVQHKITLSSGFMEKKD